MAAANAVTGRVAVHDAAILSSMVSAILSRRPEVGRVCSCCCDSKLGTSRKHLQIIYKAGGVDGTPEHHVAQAVVSLVV